MGVLSNVHLIAIIVICFVLFFAGSGYGNPTYRTRCLGLMARCTDNIDGYSVSSATFNRLHTSLESYFFQPIDRVKSNNFGHQLHSDRRLQTVKIQMRRLLESSHQDFQRLLTKIVHLFFHSNDSNIKQTRLLSEFT